MNQEQLMKKIQYSLQDGFTEQEIRQVLRQQGVKHSRINQAFNQIQNQNSQNRDQRSDETEKRNQRPSPDETRGSQINNQDDQGGFNQQDSFNENSGSFDSGFEDQGGFSQQDEGFQDEQEFQQGNGFEDQGQSPQQDQVTEQNQRSSSGLGLTDSYYRIRQRLLLQRYSIYDENDEKVLKAKKKILSIKTNIPFLSPNEGDPVFRVVSSRFPNISNNYKVKDERSDDVMAVLDRKRTLLNQVWRIRDPNDNSIVARISNDSTALQALRSYGGMIPLVPNVFALAPHTYNIVDVNENQIGQLEGELSIRDEYELNLEDSGQLDRKEMISSIIAIDALEGN